MKAGRDQVPANLVAQTETQEVETTDQNHMTEITIWTQPQVRRLRRQRGQLRQGPHRHHPLSRKCNLHLQIHMLEDSNQPHPQEEVRLQARHNLQTTVLDRRLTHALSPKAKTETETETDLDLEADTTGQPLPHRGLNQDQTQQAERTISPAQVQKPSSLPSTVKTMCP